MPKEAVVLQTTRIGSVIQDTLDLKDGEAIEYYSGQSKVKAEITTRPHIDKNKGFEYSRVPVLRVSDVNAKGYRIEATRKDYDLETMGAVVVEIPNAGVTRVYTRMR